ncbi:MAG: SDR family NAD(P)-dependent oxidoreductase [Bacteroidales bacterium]|nr:SDR family NAD(P)-dependent oxidoreductase [Bacteroidales bacterium]MCF8350782.1 SDR family NAD(P)-dependent oxidoreductase [Bacteroidales bacterium]MCF8376852.1 SDR family NAD(P)-dependent oxidoreductase [Bacteroidales bacterium]MCF8401867.1 SDR family NAD(P)-dependent oxidoreductase [Bacteroidales bacterium]
MEQKRTALVTGGYGAIGQAICRQLAEKDYQVAVAGRNKMKLQRAVEEIIQQSGNRAVTFELVDLSEEQSIIALSERWNGPLHVLVNNASTTPRRREENKEGVEMQWATNVLGYYRMIKYMHPMMEGREDARIVNVASYWAGGLDLDDPEFKDRPYDNDTAYRAGKQADRMLSSAFAERLKDKGISVNAVHPGDVNSKLSNNLGYGGFESPDQGADTPVWAATAEELKGVSGKYFEHRQESSDNFLKDKEMVNRLMEICERY